MGIPSNYLLSYLSLGNFSMSGKSSLKNLFIKPYYGERAQVDYLKGLGLIILGAKEGVFFWKTPFLKSGKAGSYFLYLG